MALLRFWLASRAEMPKADMPHTATAFDSDLQEFTRLVAEMAGLAERMIVDSVDALVRRDVALGQRVVTADGEIDKLQRTIEERAVLTIARRQLVYVVLDPKAIPAAAPEESISAIILPPEAVERLVGRTS